MWAEVILYTYSAITFLITLFFTIKLFWMVCNVGVNKHTINVIRQPHIYGCISVFGLWLFSLLIAYSLVTLEKENIVDSLINNHSFFAFFVIFIAVFGGFSLNYRVEVLADRCIHTNFLLIRKTYMYEKMSAIQFKDVTRYYYNDKWQFSVMNNAVNAEELLYAVIRYHS